MAKRNRPATAMLAMLVLTVLLSGGLASRVVAAELSAAPPDGPIQGSVRHAFILSDSGRGKVLRYDADGQLVWECDAPDSYDVCVAPNGNVVFTCRIKGPDHGVREVTPDKKVVWEYKTTGEVFACQRLADGNTLVGESTRARLVEVNPEGQIVKEIKVKVLHGGHGTLRVARKTKAGTYIVGHPGDACVREYSAEGEVIREIKTPGPAYGAQRLDNGHVVFSCEHFVIEVDKDGKEVWRLSDKEIPEVGPKWLACIVRLPNGNTVVGNWLGHGQEGKGVPLFEVTPDKKVVWQFTDTKTTRNVAGFAILGGE